MRGFNRPGDYNSRILLLTDGSRRNDALYDQAPLGHEAPVEIDWIKRLEFVSGPASAVYGANALFGIANAVMLDGSDINGTRATLDYGSGNSSRLGLVAGQRLEQGGDWFFGFASYAAQGRDLYQREFAGGGSDGWARGLDGEKYQKAYGKLRLGNWRLTGSFSARDKDIPNASYGTVFGQAGTRTLDQSHLVELAYDGLLESGWQQQARLFTGSYRYNGDYRYEASNRDIGRADWAGADYRLSRNAGGGHRLMVGMETQWNYRLQQRNHELGAAAPLLDHNRGSHTLGFFLQDEWRLHPQWLLNLGLRHDHHSGFSGMASPRAALIFQASPDLTLKAMAGSAYRPPNAYERFYHDGGESQKANPALRPERMRSLELAADKRLGESGRMGLSLYRNTMSDLIDQVSDADGLQVFTNQARVRTHGVELDAENRWAQGYRLRGSIAWQVSRHADSSELANSPRALGKLVFGVPLVRGWTAAGEWLAMGDRRSLAASVPGHARANLVVSSPRSARYGEFSAGFYNVANRRYADPASSAFIQDAIVQDGRQFRLRWLLPL